jgi:serine/threonine protein kinase
MGQEETQLIAGFDMLAKLSSGGMGDVLLARRRGAHGFEKLLAIKTIRADLARRTDIRAMFHDEARLSARLDHPTIAQVYDFGEQADGTLYLAMEYVPGIAVNKLLAKRGGPLPPAVAMRIVGEVLRGLHAAHELRDLDGTPLGVVHRDVSPGNLILTFDGHMKILDFGIAFMKNRESPDTVVGELKGKPSYMAPEHMRGLGVDRRADIYSVSVVLHELLTGRKLFTRETVVATMLAVEQHPVQPPSSICGPLPEGLDEIVIKGLERDANDRFSDGRTMAAALDRVLASLPHQQPLEAFVESELHKEREDHRAWLQQVLSGREPTSPPQDRKRPTTGAHEPRASEPTKPASPAAAVSPLVDATTLIPAGGDPSEPVQAVPPDPARRAMTWSLIAVASLIGGFLGYRFAFDSDEVTPPPPQRSAEVREREPPSAKEDPTTAVSSTSASPVAALPEVEHEVEPPEHVEKRRPTHHHPAKKKVHEEHGETTQKPVIESSRPDGFGYVTIGAQPYALVRIDGQEVGATPIMRKKLPAGAHVIELVRPDSGEVRLKRSVTLTDGDHQRVMIP